MYFYKKKHTRISAIKNAKVLIDAINSEIILSTVNSIRSAMLANTGKARHRMNCDYLTLTYFLLISI